MRSLDPTEKIRQLQGILEPRRVSKVSKPLVKICGIKDVPTALAAAESGADFIGLMFTESTRRISVQTAKEIIEALKKWKGSKEQHLPSLESVPRDSHVVWFHQWMNELRK